MAALTEVHLPVKIDLIAGTAPEPFSTSHTSNWVARVGGLPTLFQHVAHDLMEKGNLDESHAISEAIGIVHNWAHGHDGRGHPVSPAVVAEAVKAIAEWDAKRARAHAMAISAIEHQAVDLAFSEMLHPRVPSGKTGGGRFASKKGGSDAPPSKGSQRKGRKGIRPRFQIKTQGTPQEKTAHRHARDVLYGISGVKKGGLTAEQQRNRRKVSDASTLVRRWNAQPRAKRLAAMRAFLKRQATLPKGWTFNPSDGTLTIAATTSVPSRLRRIVELARLAIYGPEIDMAPSQAERDRAESKNQAMPGGRFPIRNTDDLAKAIRAVGRAKPNTEEERAKVRRFIIKRAKALGAANMLPDNWKADGSLG